MNQGEMGNEYPPITLVIQILEKWGPHLYLHLILFTPHLFNNLSHVYSIPMKTNSL